MQAPTTHCRDIAVIVPVTRTDLEPLWRAFRGQTFPRDRFEVLLITDEAIGLPEDLNCRVIHCPHRNPAHRRNLGVSESTAPIVAFTDDDAQPSPDWLANAWALFEGNPDLGLIGGPRLIPDNAGFLERVTDVLAHSKFFGNGHGNPRPEKVAGSVPLGYINACNTVCRREAFEAVGGFNPNIGFGGEDTDLVYWLRRWTHFGVRYSWDVSVVHHRRPFGWPLMKQRFRYRANNGRTIWANPRYYLGRPLFAVGVLGVTVYVVLSVLWLEAFVWGAAGYAAGAVLFSVPYVRRDWRLPLVLPVAYFVLHVVYYVGIVWGIVSILWTAPRIARMRRWRRSVLERRRVQPEPSFEAAVDGER